MYTICERCARLRYSVFPLVFLKTTSCNWPFLVSHASSVAPQCDGSPGHHDTHLWAWDEAQHFGGLQPSPWSKPSSTSSTGRYLGHHHSPTFLSHIHPSLKCFTDYNTKREMYFEKALKEDKNSWWRASSLVTTKWPWCSNRPGPSWPVHSPKPQG